MKPESTGEDELRSRLPSLHAIVATVERLLDGTAADRAGLLLDPGDGGPAAVLECEAGGGARVVCGEARFGLTSRPGPEGPMVDLGELRRLPAIEVRPEAGELVTPVGGVEHLAGAVRALAGGLPGRSVVTVEWPTSDPSAPLSIAARVGEPLVLALGDEQFQMPPEWP